MQIAGCVSHFLDKNILLVQFFGAFLVLCAMCVGMIFSREKN